MTVLRIALGVVLILIFGGDAVDTLVSTRVRSGRWWPNTVFYRWTWHPYRAIASRVPSVGIRESLLSIYGPMSLLALLAIWVSGQIVGWGLIWSGLGGSFVPALRSIGDSIYFSGVAFFTVGFGDLLPRSGTARFLTLVEAMMGLGTIGLVIGYLPSLYGAYQAREREILLLDDLTDSRITPGTLLRSWIGPERDLSAIDTNFERWTEWCAEVYSSHSSFPMLTLFRSQHRGHSWVTALGVVTDAAMSTIATLPGADRGPAMRLYRQSCRAITDLAAQVGVQPLADEPMPARFWSLGYASWQLMADDIYSFEESYRRLLELRAAFTPWMEAFIEALDAPRGIWGVTASEHLREAELGSTIFE